MVGQLRSNQAFSRSKAHRDIQYSCEQNLQGSGHSESQVGPKKPVNLMSSPLLAAKVRSAGFASYAAGYESR